ncbi:MAG TPA: hypothetical protein VGG74_09005 [Kofleriaceae bacterium]
MKKCAICTLGSWVVGVTALAVGVAAVTGHVPAMTTWLRVVLAIAGVVGLGFLFYQPPLAPCPRCVRANERVTPPMA